MATEPTGATGQRQIQKTLPSVYQAKQQAHAALTGTSHTKREFPACNLLKKNHGVTAI
jgi:hypothetical protein